MKIKLLSLALGLLVTQNSFATGGFSCFGKTNSGSTVTVAGRVPFGIPTLCSSVTVYVDNKEILVIPKTNVPAFYISDRFFGFLGMDENFDERLVSLEYFGPESDINYMVVNDSKDHQFKFKNVNCDFE